MQVGTPPRMGGSKQGSVGGGGAERSTFSSSFESLSLIIL